jgi:long-chain acyl-CoA synthetase
VLKAGAIHVPLPVSVSEQKLTSVINMTKPVNILVDSVIQLKRVQSLGASLIKGTTISMVKERGLNSTKVNLEDLKHRNDSVEPDDTAVILFSSGSTTSSKGVPLSNRNIPVAAEEFGNSDVFNNVQRSLSVLPVRHSAA